MRFSTLPLAIGAAAIALGGLIAPTASAADLTIENNLCEISFTDSEIRFFQSKFTQARVSAINALKAEMPNAAVELNELQELLEEADFEASEPSFWEKEKALTEKISAKGAEAGFREIDNGSEMVNEVEVVLQFLPSFVLFENLGIHYWDIYYNQDTDLLQLSPTSAGSVLSIMNLPFEFNQMIRDESLPGPGMSERGIKIIEDAFLPLQDLRTPFSPVFEACGNDTPGSDLGGDVTGDAPGDTPGDNSGNDEEPAGRTTGSSLGSS